MKDYLKTAWWVLLVEGIALLLFGLFTVVYPHLTLGAFVVGFGIFLLISGVVGIITALVGMKELPLWGLRLVLSALEVGVGIYALRHLAMTAATMVLLVGLVFVVRGILEVVFAMGDGFDGKSRTLTALSGILSLIVGVVAWVYPGAAGLAFVWVLGVYGLVAGALVLVLAFEAQALSRKVA
jgi:uncharacterized membrane protein HdeD (DUF308 family)